MLENDKESNDLVAYTCKTLGINKQALAKELGVHYSIFSKWHKNGIPISTQNHLKLLVQNHILRTQLRSIKEIMQSLNALDLG